MGVCSLISYWRQMLHLNISVRSRAALLKEKENQQAESQIRVTSVLHLGGGGLNQSMVKIIPPFLCSLTCLSRLNLNIIYQFHRITLYEIPPYNLPVDH